MKSSLPSDVVRSASLYFEGLGTPMALGAYLRVKHQLWDEVSEVTPDPRNYLERDHDRYARDALACGLLRKLQDLPTTHDRRDAALQKWRSGEIACYRTNERLARYLPEFANSADQEVHVRTLLRAVRKKVRSWIGDRPPDLLSGRFGPGATFSDRGRKTTVPDKMSSDPSITRSAIWYLPQWYGTQWGAALAHRNGKVSFVAGNRFTTVPKTAKTDRAIAAEPSINVFYQLALGRVLRRRLREKTGWDLDRAQDIHRQVALESSVTREFATLDLSNASDTVATNLVRLCLPHRWFEALADLRSPKTLVDGKWVVLEKFSSMGNGFTFELETLLFAAISCVVTEMSGVSDGQLGFDVCVFGDDIIVKNEVVASLKPVLEFLGFELNAEKSYFGDEPFRESCGGDYFAGKPARPFFLKDLPSEPQDNIAFANGLRAASKQLTSDRVAVRAWFSVLDSIPTRVRSCRGPVALGDIVIHDDEERWISRWRSSIRYLQVYRPSRLRIVKYDLFSPEVVLACATYGCGNRQGGVIPRDGVRGYKVGWVPRS